VGQNNFDGSKLKQPVLGAASVIAECDLAGQIASKDAIQEIREKNAPHEK
jgi:hypothetical protein